MLVLHVDCGTLQSHKANYAMPVEIATSSRVSPLKPIYNVPAKAGGAHVFLQCPSTVFWPWCTHAILTAALGLRPCIDRDARTYETQTSSSSLKLRFMGRCATHTACWQLEVSTARCMRVRLTASVNVFVCLRIGGVMVRFSSHGRIRTQSAGA